MKILGIIIGILIILMFLMAKAILFFVFGKRSEGNPKLKYFTADDFDGLKAKPIEFKSNKGQTLRGNIYTHEEVKDYKGVIVFAHGMGGAGHYSYTTEINTFAKAGFLVIGYDNTGCYKSDGKNLRGFFQSVIDLKYALKYISENEELNKYGVALVGHSWGAYTICQELQYNPNVKAVVALSGVNNFSKVLCEQVESQTKFKCGFLAPFFSILNFFTFGKDAMKNTVKILDKTNIPVLVLHGDSDTTVLEKSSLIRDYKNENIKTILYKDKCHNVYQTRESEKYLNETFAKIGELNKKYKGKIPEDESNKIYDSIDYKKITEEDEEVMNTAIKFIEEKIKL